MPSVDDLPPPPSGIDDLPPPVLPDSADIRRAFKSAVDKDKLGGGVQAAIEHFGNAAALGYAPQLQAAVSQIMPNPTSGLDEKLRSQGFTIVQPNPTYVQDRDENIKRLQQQQIDHPIASTAGSVAGALTTGIATSGITPINAATRLGRIAQAARGGAILGAVANPGDKEGVVDPIQSDARESNAAYGAALGIAGQGVIEGIGAVAKGVGNLSSRLKNNAEERAFKSSGAMLKDYRKAAGNDQVNNIGRFMLDEGIGKPGASFEDIANHAEAIKGDAGNVIQSTYQKANDLANNPEVINNLSPELKSKLAETEFKPTEFADKFEQSLKDKFRGTPGFNKALPQVQSVLSDIRDIGDSANILQLQKAKVDVQNLVNYDKDIRDQPMAKQLLSRLRNELSDKVQSRIDTLGAVVGEDALTPLKEANKRYGMASEVSGIASDRVLREHSNRFFSPSDYGVSGAGAVAGATIGYHEGGVSGAIKGGLVGGSMGLINKAARTYGTPFVSSGLDAAGKFLSKPLSVVQATAPMMSAIQKSPIAESNVVRALSQPKLEQSAIAPLTSVAENNGQSNRKPAVQLKGEDLWAQQGVSKLGIDQDTANKASNSKQGKSLLIQASSLPAGSKKLQMIKDKISQGWGK